MKKKFILEGLNCSNCAIKIETAVRGIKEYEDVEYNFATSTLTLRSDIDENKVLEVVEKIVKTYEPDVFVKKATDEQLKIDFNKKLLIRFFISFSLFFSAIFINLSNYLELVLLMSAYIIIGYDILYKSLKDVLGGRLFDENFLMTVATVGAIGIGEYHEAVAVILFYQFGEYLQGLAVSKSRVSISKLMNIKAEFANKRDMFNVLKVKPETLEIGDIILIKPGEKVPVDGNVIDGEGYLDTVQLTGESKLRKVVIGDSILSGFINKETLLTVKVTKRYEDSAVAKILDLVENASNKKAKTEQFITKFAKVYTPIIVVLATLITLVPWIVFNQEFSVWLYRALVFLVVSCPCALVVSVPLGYFSGIGVSSNHGILVKGGNFLEALNFVDTFVFDKTGTLTEGKFKVNTIKTFNGFSNEELIKYASFAEVHSNHPIAQAIKNEINEHLSDELISEHLEVPGKGVKSVVENKEILVGNFELMKDNNIQLEKEKVDTTIIYVAIDSVYAGYILIYDKIKEETKKTLDYLSNKLNKHVYMLTGDNNETAEKIATELGIEKYYGNLLPNDKVTLINEIISKSENKVAFIGDGTNDAPVLKIADVGISMGSMGSDAAIEASDVVIMNDDIFKIVEALKISKKTRNIVIQNIVFALSVKGIVLILGALGLASMKAAVFADVGVAILAIMNSLRILNTKLK